MNRRFHRTPGCYLLSVISRLFAGSAVTRSGHTRNFMRLALSALSALSLAACVSGITDSSDDQASVAPSSGGGSSAAGAGNAVFNSGGGPASSGGTSVSTPSGGGGMVASGGASSAGTSAGGTSSALPSCTFPNWVAMMPYSTGDKVLYNGAGYIATMDNPGYDPTISTYFWSPFPCTPVPGSGAQVALPAPPTSGGGAAGAPTNTDPTCPLNRLLVNGSVSFDAMFQPPWAGHVAKALYSYTALCQALGTTGFSAFANSGDMTKDRRELAAFFAHVAKETAFLEQTDEAGEASNAQDYHWPRRDPDHGRVELSGRWPVPGQRPGQQSRPRFDRPTHQLAIGALVLDDQLQPGYGGRAKLPPSDFDWGFRADHAHHQRWHRVSRVTVRARPRAVLREQLQRANGGSGNALGLLSWPRTKFAGPPPIRRVGAKPSSAPVSGALEAARCEGVAAGKRAVVEPSLEPARALGCGAVRPRFGMHDSGLDLLNVIIPHGGGSSEGLFDVTGVENLTLARGARPNSGEAIRLQLEAHAEPRWPKLRGLSGVLDALGDAQLFLHVVPNLMGDHVGLGEIPPAHRSAERARCKTRDRCTRARRWDNKTGPSPHHRNRSRCWSSR